MVRVVLVDDHGLVREGLAAVLSDDSAITVVTHVGSAEEAVRCGAEADVVVSDVRLPGMSGIELCVAVRSRCPPPGVVPLTAFPSVGFVADALAAGADALVVKTSDTSSLRAAVYAAARGEHYVDSRLGRLLACWATRDLSGGSDPQLTLREQLVLEQVAAGLTNREVAAVLGIGEETVKTHVAGALRKLGARNRTHAAVLAVGRGLV